MYKYFPLFILLLIGCTSKIDQSLLHGKWKAHQIIEQGNIKDMDLTLVHFEFDENGKYLYHDNLNSEEAGRFYVVGEILFTTDTTAVNPLEKSVRIAMLSQDSLHFQMNAGGVPQIFKLFRSKD